MKSFFKSLGGLLTPSGKEKQSPTGDDTTAAPSSSSSSRALSPTQTSPRDRDAVPGLPSPRSPNSSIPSPSSHSATSMSRSARSNPACERPHSVPRPGSLPPVVGRMGGGPPQPQQSPFSATSAGSQSARRMSAVDYSQHYEQQQQHQHDLMRPSRDSSMSKSGRGHHSSHGLAPIVTNVNMSADYAQEDDGDEQPPPECASPLAISHALLKARLSQGSATSKLNTSESLKSLLHLDQYSFFSDIDVQEAQLQVDTELLQTLLNMDDNVSPSSPASAAVCSSKSNILAVSPALPHAMRRVRWSLDDYVLLKQLHKGYASDVFHAQCKMSREMVALKVYKLAEQCDLQRVQLYREIRLHSQLMHTNVVQFYAGFLEEERVVLVQEFAGGGDLLKFMTNLGGRLMERQAVSLVLQPFLAALQYLHTQGIVHRDIKPENVLLTDSQQLKLADFGLAIDLNEERANTRAGTLDYMAPEVLRCPTKHTPDEGKMNPSAAHYQLGADAWAVGIFAYELVTGLRPFKAKQNIEIARNIIHAQVTFPDSMSEMSKDFVSQALQKHPGDRPTVIEMLHHPWVTMFQRRSSVHYAYTRSNSLMEIMAARKSTTNTPERGGGGSGLKRGSGAEHRVGLDHHRLASEQPHRMSSMPRERDGAHAATATQYL